MIQSNGPRLEIEEGETAGDAATLGASESGTSHLSLQAAERQHILASLERLGWRIEGPGGAAEVLGLPASTLRSRMKKLKVSRGGVQPVPTAV